MNIVVIGNSVGMLIRPPRKSREEGNFCELIDRKFHGSTHGRIINRCRSAVVVDDLLENEIDYITSNSPDIVVVICGINEAVSRPLPRTIYQYLNKRRPLISPLGKAFQWINAGLNRYFFPYVIKYFSLSGWFSSEKYVERLTLLVDEIVKETRGLVILVSLLPCTQRIEKLLPGSTAHIAKFNLAIHEAMKNKDFVEIVCLASDTQVCAANVYTPDGIHMSANAHAELAEKLWAVIASRMQIQ